MAALAQAPLDVLVIGGGIVGAGVVRDAAMRGLRAGLVEQGDFASGTSSRSSRLLHGGLRYLAQGRLGLVRQASLEKRILHHIAPHLAQPLAFVFPTYRSTQWPLWQMRVGVKLYDLLCSGKNLGQSSTLTPAHVLAALPDLDSRELTGGVRYFDAVTNDSRLVLDTLRSAARHGALLVNYCRFEDAAREDSSWNCWVKERVGGGQLALRARVIVNATGPWAPAVPHSRVKLRLTKGIHLVVPKECLPAPDAVVITQAKRLLFIIPWGDRRIVGTTDTDYQGSLDEVHAEPEDVDYVLGTLGSFFPSAAISESDILATWAGVRPLIAVPGGAPSDIGRGHEIHRREEGWWDVAGGKLTTYRLMAEQTLDQVSTSLGVISVCRTAEEPLLPPADTIGVSGILPPDCNRETVEHYCRNEWVLHLDDLMLRRTGWQYYRTDARQVAKQAAEWMAELLNWSDGERAAELEHSSRMSAPV